MTTTATTCKRAAFCLVLAASCFLTVSCAALRQPFDAGLFASRDKTPVGSARLRAAGPIFERQEDGGKTYIGARPFYSRMDDLGNDRSLRDYVWPVAMYKDFNNQTYWRFLLAYGNDFDNQAPDGRWKTIIFPFVYMGRDIHDEKYFAVFPIGGKINEFLGRDTIKFALFPIYMYTSINDVRTYDVLWPFVSWTYSGDKVSRYRVFPIYGQSKKDDIWSKRFVMWPIWTSAAYSYPDGQKGGGFILWPLFGHSKLTDQETWMLAPPFFRWSWNDKGYRSGNLPWPFFQYSSGGPSEKLYIWPIWGRHRTEGSRSTFFAWPIGSTLNVQRSRYSISRFSLFPFWFHEKRTAKEGQAVASNEQDKAADKVTEPLSAGVMEPLLSGFSEEGPTQAALNKLEPALSTTNNAAREQVFERYWKFWPVVSWQRQGADMRFRMLELWPGKHMPAIERNYAPLWTLYSHVRSGGASEDEILWGMIRRNNDAVGKKHFSVFPIWSQTSTQSEDKRRWSFLMGLFGYQREGLQKKYRLLYFINFSTHSGEQP